MQVDGVAMLLIDLPAPTLAGDHFADMTDAERDVALRVAAGQSNAAIAKARAALHGRFTAEHEDVRAMAHPILRHRLVMGFRARADAVDPEQVVKKLLDSVRP